MKRISEQELRTLISNGENDTVEFNRLLPNRMVLSKQIAAFANSMGGYIIIGVTDSREIVGSSELLDNTAILDLPLKNYPKIDIYSLKIEGKTVNVVSVEKQSNGFTTCNGQLYSRLGDSNQLMSRSQIEQSFLRNQCNAASVQETLAEMNQQLENLRLENIASSNKSTIQTIIWSLIGAVVGAILGQLL